MKLTVQSKLLMGFGAVLAVVGLVSSINFVMMNRIATQEQRLMDLRMPTVIAGLELADGVHLSLAGLRGYMILGKEPAAAEKFKAERQSGWALIDQAVAKMEGYSRHWTDPANVQKLAELKELIAAFRTAQQEVEDIAHTPENIPAFKMLLTEAAPRAAQIVASLTAIIDEESRLEATPERKRLLKLLADSRGSFAMGLTNIRAYLLSGDTRFADNFRNKWALNETRFEQLSHMTGLFNATQAKAWRIYVTERQAFAPLPPKMFALRAGKDWNLANYWLGTKAAPKAAAIMGVLADMRASQERLASQDAAALASDSHTMEVAMAVGTLLVLGLGLVIALFISRLVTRPLKAVVERAKAIAGADLSGVDLLVKGRDELAELVGRFRLSA